MPLFKFAGFLIYLYTGHSFSNVIDGICNLIKNMMNVRFMCTVKFKPAWVRTRIIIIMSATFQGLFRV